MSANANGSCSRVSITTGTRKRPARSTSFGRAMGNLTDRRNWVEPPLPPPPSPRRGPVSSSALASTTSHAPARASLLPVGPLPPPLAPSPPPSPHDQTESAARHPPTRPQSLPTGHALRPAAG